MLPSSITETFAVQTLVLSGSKPSGISIDFMPSIFVAVPSRESQ